ncbi:Inorganic phosphate transporter 2-1, chloroplastic [Gracilariopsis chorda]|uniref:Phosphate transporter n=1 Tax=Gracilariopsis chorda TaxID=448386 RepID=A0A2V3IPM3_9FLOR|nr:Inorganic phosphate transporter 2-1, chloroplastic [Gracilariopsis chorda]|eukprot:PXF44028.1 Inorganic phosphate transporter 2-1, chloroplastic [Gracilariopsis chorda]
MLSTCVPSHASLLAETKTRHHQNRPKPKPSARVFFHIPTPTNAHNNPSSPSIPTRDALLTAFTAFTLAVTTHLNPAKMFFDDPFVLLCAGAVGGFGMLFVLGANDVANSIGVPIGCGALTPRAAIFLAALCNILGASLAGSRVSHTLSKGVSPKLAEDASSHEAALAFLAVLLSAMFIIFIGTVLALPLSSTHAVVGAVAGAAVMLHGASALHMEKLWQIASAWLVSPLVGAVFAFVLRIITNVALSNKQTSHIVAPILSGLTTAAVGGVLTDSLAQVLGFEIPRLCDIWSGLAIAFAVGFVIGFVAVRSEYEYRENNSLAKNHPSDSEAGYGSTTSNDAAPVVTSADSPLTESSSLFGALLVCTVPALSFAHGSNDVSNGVGPFVAILRYYVITESGDKNAVVPHTLLLAVLATGGVAIAMGLTIFGERVIATIGGSGEKSLSSQPWTFAKAFPAQFAAAASVLMASSFGLPVSTSHAVVGSVVGVRIGSANGVNWATLSNILIGAALTPVLAAIVCVIILGFLRVVL